MSAVSNKTLRIVQNKKILKSILITAGLIFISKTIYNLYLTVLMKRKCSDFFTSQLKIYHSIINRENLLYTGFLFLYLILYSPRYSCLLC